jgi:hypothetical protein
LRVRAELAISLLAECAREADHHFEFFHISRVGFVRPNLMMGSFGQISGDGFVPPESASVAAEQALLLVRRRGRRQACPMPWS